MPKITTDLKTAVIKKGDSYVKVLTNKYKLVESIMYATCFTVADAQEYIQNHIKKPLREQFVIELLDTNYKTKTTQATRTDSTKTESVVVDVAEPAVDDITDDDLDATFNAAAFDIQQYSTVTPDADKTEVMTALQEVKKLMVDQLIEKQHKYMDKLRYYNDAIMDIRHYIRDASTELDTEQAAQVLYRLQQVERDRATVKRELRRISTVFDSINSAIEVADTYDYEPYKPRVIVDMYNFLQRGV